jgi:hypothetical protein
LLIRFAFVVLGLRFLVGGEQIRVQGLGPETDAGNVRILVSWLTRHSSRLRFLALRGFLIPFLCQRTLPLTFQLGRT